MAAYLSKADRLQSVVNVQDLNTVIQREWILLMRLNHTAAYPQYSSKTSALQQGDWLLKINGVVIPFFCQEGVIFFPLYKLLCPSYHTLFASMLTPCSPSVSLPIVLIIFLMIGCFVYLVDYCMVSQCPINIKQSTN